MKCVNFNNINTISTSLEVVIARIMDQIELGNEESLEKAIERANEICLEPIRCHWDGTLFLRNPTADEEVSKNVDDLRFKLGFDHIELTNSKMEEKQDVSLIDSIGSLKTSTMTFTFKLSDAKINGRIRICSVLSQCLESNYRLHLTKIFVKSTVGLDILENSYSVHHIIHEFTDASISLVYKKLNKMIPVYSNVQAKNIKHSLVQYILNKCTKNAIANIEDKLRSAFDLTSVSISFGDKFSLRNEFRIHAKLMKEAFKNLVDEIIDSTNSLLIEKVPTLSLPNVSVILDYKKDEKKSFQGTKNSLTGLNFLFRRKNVLVLLESDLIVLYVPVDFADLNVKYKYWSIKYGEQENRATEVEEHYKTEGSYLTISIQKQDHGEIDINLLEFKIANSILLDTESQLYIDDSLRAWINSIFEFQVAPVIENMFEKYLRIVMQDKKFKASALEGIVKSNL